MKYSNGPLVKEQMKFRPTTPAKSKSTTSTSNIDWVDKKHREVKGPIGWRPEYQDCIALEKFEELSPGYNQATEDKIIDYSLSPFDPVERQNTNLISNNPRKYKDNVDRFVDYASVNYEYAEQSKLAKDGYKIKELSGLDEEYTSQHSTIFYQDVIRKDKKTGKTIKGFLERGNYLDRI